MIQPNRGLHSSNLTCFWSTGEAIDEESIHQWQLRLQGGRRYLAAMKKSLVELSLEARSNRQVISKKSGKRPTVKKK